MVRKRPGLLLWLAVVLVPAVLTTLMLAVRTGAIEDDLRDRSLDALESQGIKGVEVEMSGRDAVVKVPAGTDAGRVREIVSGIEGVRVVENAGSLPASPSSPTPTPTGPAPSPAAPFSISRIGDTVEITGSAPTTAVKTAILDAARAEAGGVQLVERIAIDPNAKPPKTADLAKLVKIAATIPGDLSVNFDGATIALTGQVADHATRIAAGDAAAAALPGVTIENRLRIGSLTPEQASCRIAQSRIIQLMAGNRITFQPETAVLTWQSRELIAKLAAVLEPCPGVRIEVAGHTDNQGNPAASLPLSQRRAGAVKMELVRLGVFANRIRAVGYGHSQPVATNATVEGRTANRRVEIKVL